MFILLVFIAITFRNNVVSSFVGETTLFNETIDYYTQYEARADAVQNNDIIFDLPDLLIDSERDNIHLEAFRTKNNDEILREANAVRYPQLQWVSIGRPTIRSIVLNDPNSFQLFRFTNRGFYVLIQMLTDEHRTMFRNLVKRKLGIDTDTTQFANLIPAKFECVMKLVNSNGDDFIIKGVVEDLRNFPLKLMFEAKANTKERLYFEELLKESGENFDEDIRCEVYSNGRVSRQNTLTISSSQLNQLGITDQIFGPADEVYVSRNQMTALSSEIYMKMNIIEDYEIPQTEFSKSFVDDFIRQTSESTFRDVSIDEAIQMISKYAVDVKGDLKANVIKSEMSKLFKIDKSEGKEHLIVDETQYEHLKTGSSDSKSGGLSLGFKLFGVSSAAGYTKSKANDWHKSNKNLNDQLRELNTLQQSDIQWERQGDVIVPKSINVARMAKSSFSKTFLFSRIRVEKYEASFKKIFTLNTLKTLQAPLDNKSNPNPNQFITETLKENLENISVRIKNMNMDFNSLVNENKELKMYLKKLIEEGNDLKLEFNTLKNEYKDIRTNLNELKNKLLKNVVFSSDGSTIKIWNTDTDECIKTLPGHTSTVYGLSLLRNGNLASCSYDKTIKIWNITTGECIRTLFGHINWVKSLLLLSNGYLASGSTDATIKIWNTNSGECIKTLTGHTGTVSSLTLLSNGNLASGSYDKTIKIWNTQTGVCIKTLNGHIGGVYSLSLLSNGNLASGSFDFKIKIWNTNTGECIKTLVGHNDWVTSLSLLSNGNLASGSNDNDKTIKIWNTNTGECIKTLTGHTGIVTSLSVLRNGNLVSGSSDGTIKIWNTNTAECITTLVGQNFVNSVILLN